MAVLLLSAGGAASAPLPAADSAALMARMAAASALLVAYQMEAEVNEYQDDRIVGTRRFQYSFKKPDHVRIDMLSPYAGMTLVSPAGTGKVAVRYGFLRFHLSADNALLQSSMGQRIDQTDLGLLISNIGHSLTDRRHGEVAVADQDDRLLVQVLAEDHFRPGVLTSYRFSIDKLRALPVAVEEFTPDGRRQRTVVFRNLRIRQDMPVSLFQSDGE